MGGTERSADRPPSRRPVCCCGHPQSPQAFREGLFGAVEQGTPVADRIVRTAVWIDFDREQIAFRIGHRVERVAAGGGAGAAYLALHSGFHAVELNHDGPFVAAPRRRADAEREFGERPGGGHFPLSPGPGRRPHHEQPGEGVVGVGHVPDTTAAHDQVREAGGPLRTLRALGPLRTLRAGLTLGPLSTGGALRTLSTGGALRTLSTGGALRTLRAGGALRAFQRRGGSPGIVLLRTVDLVRVGIDVEVAVGAFARIGRPGAAEDGPAIGAIAAIGTVLTVISIGTSDTGRPLESLQTL